MRKRCRVAPPSSSDRGTPRAGVPPSHRADLTPRALSGTVLAG